MTEVNQEERRQADIAKVREFFALETEYAAKMRVPANATKEEKAAREAIAAARIQNEFGYGNGDLSKVTPRQWCNAKVGVVTETGDLKVMVSKQDLSDARTLAANETLTYPEAGVHNEMKRGQLVEVAHEAGSHRKASAVARILYNNQDAIRNTETGKTGFDAIDMGKGKARLAYLKPDVIVANAEASRSPGSLLKGLTESTRYTRETLGFMDLKVREKSRATAKAKEAGGQER